MREEFAEHECVVGFGVVFGKSDVFVHVECDDVLEAEKPCMLACERRGRMIEERTRASHPSPA